MWNKGFHDANKARQSVVPPPETEKKNDREASYVFTPVKEGRYGCIGTSLQVNKMKENTYFLFPWIPSSWEIQFSREDNSKDRSL